MSSVGHHQSIPTLHNWEIQKKRRKIVEEIMANHFPNFMKYNQKIQQVHWTQDSKNSKGSIPRHIRVKLLKVKKTDSRKQQEKNAFSQDGTHSEFNYLLPINKAQNTTWWSMPKEKRLSKKNLTPSKMSFQYK